MPDLRIESHRAEVTARPRLAVSFIIPLFNCLELTQAMFRSLQATVPGGLAHEIIFVDDGSTDGTREWLRTLAHPVRVILNERNLGYAAANNRAAGVASGETLFLLNNDLVLLPRWLEPMIAARRSLGRKAGLVGNVQLDARTGGVDHTGIVFSVKAKPEHDRHLPAWTGRLLSPVRRIPAVTAACVSIATSTWRELGGFDEGFVNGGEDVDLCFRAAAAGYVNAVALRSVVRHHVSASTGRKLRDEANSARLAARWRREFIHAAARRWSREHFATLLSDPRGCSISFALRTALYAAGLSRRPPAEAVEALGAALDLEFVRWNTLLSASSKA